MALANGQVIAQGEPQAVTESLLQSLFDARVQVDKNDDYLLLTAAGMAVAILIMGGARSGKVGAQTLAEQLTDNPYYLATATAEDAEMAARIACHQAEHGHWQLCEEPLALAARLQQIIASAPDAVVVVDCLTLWLSNCLHAGCWRNSGSN